MGAHKLQENQILKSAIKTCLLFQEADESALEFAAQHAESVSFHKSEPIVLENEANDHVYFIIKGSVEIVSYLSEEKRVQRLALFKSGSHFGDFSVLTKSSRSGSAYAYEDCELLRLNGTTFLALIKKFPSVCKQLVKLLGELNQKMEILTEMIPYYNPDQLHFSREIAEILPPPTWKKFGLIPLSSKAGVVTVAMTKPHNETFFQYFKSSFPNMEVAVHLINGSEFESALDFITKSMKASRTSQRTGAAPALELKAALRSSTLFGSLPDGVVDQILPHLQPQEIKAGTNILSPNQPCEAYYLILKGQIQLYRQMSATKGLVPVLSISAGEGFGELQALAGGKSPSFVKAMEDTTVVLIPRPILQQLLVTPLFAVPLAQSLAQRIQKLSHVIGLKYFRPETALDFKAVVNILPTTIITEQQILPLKIVDDEVVLGAVTPDTAGILATIQRYMLGYRVKLLGITEEQFKSWYIQFKTQKDALTEATPAQSAPSVPHLHVVGPQSPVKLLDEVLLKGMGNRASDIHFEPAEDYLTVRYRIDGVLQERPEKIPVEAGREMISRLKILSGMDIAQQKLPQDGQFKADIEGLSVVARASAIPIKYGEKIVLRLIRQKNSVVPLNMLAPDRRTIHLLQAITRCKQGLFLVTGPTGSGKTSTLYSMLSAINQVDINVTTLEEPVEMEISGFNQVEIDRKRGLDFAGALRSVLRQDPDVIMVGEIRDCESAKIVFEAAITGHMVLSTLHTNSSLDVAPRLEELGVSPSTLSAGLLGVLSQRLLRASCKKCLTTRPTTEGEKNLFRQTLKLTRPPETVKFGKGCPSCGGSGYYGRIPVFEVWHNTLPMKRALSSKASIEEMMNIARADGFETLAEFGLRMVMSGLTTIEEVERMLSFI